MEKSLNSCERENSAESRQTERRWLRLTGSAATRPFLPYWSLLHPILHSLPPSSTVAAVVTSCASTTVLPFITHDLQA